MRKNSFLPTLLAALAVFSPGCSKKKVAETAQMPVVQVVAVEARRQSVTESLSLVGTVMANEMVELKAETDGIVQEILFEEGQKVEKGHLLIRLDESKFASAVSEGEANFRLSKSNFDRAEQLFKGKLISQQEFDQAASTFQMNQATLDLRRRQLRDARILAPFKGTVGARSISPGQVIGKNMTLTTVVDWDPVKVEFNVPERFLSQLHVGQEIEIVVAAYPGRTFKGKVFFVSSYVDIAMRTAQVKAQISNPSGELRPGMFANLDLTLQMRENAIVIPEAGINQLLDGGRANVYLADKSDTVQLRAVTLGIRLSRRVEVTAGLETGDRVIVEGTQKIGPGSKVKLAPPAAAAAYEVVEPVRQEGRL